MKWRIKTWKDLPEVGFLSAIACALVFVAATTAGHQLLEYLIINHLYGPAAWDQGLRVIDRHGTLSNGDSLIWSHFLLGFGAFILSIPFVVGTGFLCSYLGFVFKGNRGAATPPKKRRRWLELVSRPAVVRPKMNDQITARSVRLIAENGEELGVYSIADALKLVGTRREDLIEIEPLTDPPICQSMDYAKYRQQLRNR